MFVGLELDVIEKLGVSGARFALIIKVNVPDGFYCSEGNEQKKKGVSTINIYLGAFTF